MRIALIGNMNNNKFSLMRYFRDLGVDAHLFLYANDGIGSCSHFRPEDDTFDIKKWKPFIRQMQIQNAPSSALSFPANIMLSVYSVLKKMLGLNDSYALPVTKQYIRKCFESYDYILCCGIAPAFLHRVGIRVDIFSPYASGIEFFSSPEDTERINDRSFLYGWLIRKVMVAQSTGLKSVRYVCTADAGMTFAALKELDIVPIPLAIPMVYTGESPVTNKEDSNNSSIFDAIQKSNFSILMHSRLAWSETDGLVGVRSKNNHWLLYAFKELVNNRKGLRPLLLIYEYGPQVQITKNLVRELGIDASVLWLPNSPRKVIMSVLSKVDIAVGEFIMSNVSIWGGTGWEGLASGKAMLQGFLFEPGEFERIYGYPPPPMLPVRKQEDILIHLLDMADHPAKSEEIGRAAKEWFNRYNGIGLAKQWLDLLMTPRENELEFKKKVISKAVHV